MMRRTIVTIGMLSTMLALPTTAAAYITPEELLYEEDFSLRFFEPPPTRREIQDAAARQAADSAARRQAEQDALFGGGTQSSASSAASSVPTAPVIDDDLHGAAPTAEPTSTLDLRDQRALERIRDNAAQAAYEAQLRALSMDDTLHSGAPLSDTGPASWIAALAVVAAIGLTLRKVWRMGRQ